MFTHQMRFKSDLGIPKIVWVSYVGFTKCDNCLCLVLICISPVALGACNFSCVY